MMAQTQGSRSRSVMSVKAAITEVTKNKERFYEQRQDRVSRI